MAGLRPLLLGVSHGCGATMSLLWLKHSGLGLREHTFELHKSLGQVCVQIGDLAVQLGRGHE
jgi:hypothetical protein